MLKSQKHFIVISVYLWITLYQNDLVNWYCFTFLPN